MRLGPERQEKIWIAQCLEHDVGAQALQIKDLTQRFLSALAHDWHFLAQNDHDVFSNPVPAPERFVKMWNAASESPFRSRVSLDMIREGFEAELVVI